MRKTVLSGYHSEVISKNYPELRVIVDKLADSVTKQINEAIKHVKSEMPYKSQWVLEELIKELQDRV